MSEEISFYDYQGQANRINSELSGIINPRHLLHDNNDGFLNNPNLFHFTNVNTLSAILDVDQFHAYQVPGKKDDNEFVYGIEIFLSALAKKSGQPFDQMRIDLEEEREYFSARNGLGPHFYAFCLTEEETCRHWREHSLPDTESICIEFDTNKIRDNHCPNGIPFDAIKVTYEEKDAGFEPYLDIIRKTDSPNVCLAFALTLIGTVKAPCFAWEKEWRICTAPPQLSGHPQKNARGQYYPFSGIKGLIKRIIPGPKISQETMSELQKLSKDYEISLLEKSAC